MIAAGIVDIAAYLPRYRLTAEEIARTHNRPSKGSASRRVAGFDEDPVTMAVEAARALSYPLTEIESLAFCTTTPPYAGKNNASAAHAALHLPENVPAFDAGGSVRASSGALIRARPGALLLTGDVSTSRPGAATELAHGDGGGAVLFGDADAIAEIIDVESGSEELLDQWRLPQSPWLQSSEDRFPTSRYSELLDQTLARLLDRVDPDSIDHVVISAPSPRVGAAAGRAVGHLAAVHTTPGVGFSGASNLVIQLCGLLAEAAPRRSILLVSLADGCDLTVLRSTERLETHRPRAPRSADDGVTPAYIDVLTWRGLLEREPPRRPEPSPVSPPASSRSAGWKYALHGAVCNVCAAVSSPPQQVCVRCGSTESRSIDLSRRAATVRTFSVDRLAFSPNPPLVAAVVDFDGGGRLEVELTDCAPESLAVGRRVRMTFRRRHSSNGIHNYAWKATLEEAEDE